MSDADKAEALQTAAGQVRAVFTEVANRSPVTASEAAAHTSTQDL